jgi:hypothetical protein
MHLVIHGTKAGHHVFRLRFFECGTGATRGLGVRTLPDRRQIGWILASLNVLVVRDGVQTRISPPVPSPIEVGELMAQLDREIVLLDAARRLQLGE